MEKQQPGREPTTGTTLLPSIPPVLVRLHQVLREREATPEDLAAVALHDPGLSARILAAATGLAAGHRDDPASLSAILARLGQDTARTLATDALVRGFFSPFREDQGAALGRLWRRSLGCACLCRSVARLADQEAPEEAYLVGLLHNLDQWLALAAGEEDPAPAERGAALLEAWNPDSFASDAVLLRGEPLEAVADATLLVRLVNVSCTLANGELEGEALETFLERAGHVLGLSGRGIAELWQMARREVREILADYGFEEDPEAPPVDDEAARVALGRVVRDATLAGMLLRVNDKSAWQAVLDNFFLLFGPQSVAVFEHDAASGGLRGQDSRGARAPRALRRLRLPLQPGRALPVEAGLQGRPLFGDATPEGGVSGLDRQLQRLLGAPVVFALPLQGAGELLGVLVAGLTPAQAERLAAQQELLEEFRRIAVEQLERDLYSLEERLAMLETQLAGIQGRASRLVHEANNPLGVIRNYLQVLASRLEDDQDTRSQLEIIDQEIDRVGSILARLRDLGQEPEASHGAVDVNALVEELLSVFDTSLFATGRIASERELDPRLPPIRSHRNHLKQVLTNLLKNAAEALPPGGRVRVETHDGVVLDGRPQVQIVVADDGPGLPDDILRNIFTPVPSSKGPPHSGLGLVIVKNLLSEMNGSIVVQSTPERGTRFEILLPRELPDE
ncbi:MAG TPA: HDOD domain-containing protein [Gammaproteobacteria bacterium]|nr:HDOD domain-containing protein [Gammaproteobacteria bacterium]